MNKAKFLRLLTAIFAIATAILGFAHYADLLPPQYAVVVGLVTAVLLAVKEITVIIGDIADDGLRNNSFNPDGKSFMALLLICGLAGLMIGCTATQKQEAAAFGERLALTAGEAAVIIAQTQLAARQAELDAAVVTGAPSAELLAKRLALAAAQEALNKASAALAKERARIDKQPVDVIPSAAPVGELIGKEQAGCMQVNPRGLCFGTPASRKPDNRAASPLMQAPQAGRLVLMRNADPAALSFPHLPRDDTGRAVAALVSL